MATTFIRSFLELENDQPSGRTAAIGSMRNEKQHNKVYTTILKRIKHSMSCHQTVKYKILSLVLNANTILM